MANPYYADHMATLYQGDVREVLRSLPDESVQTVVTSPPYWSLRDYGIAPSVWGGDAECAHEWESQGAPADAYAGTARWQHDGVSRVETPDAWVKPMAMSKASTLDGGKQSGVPGVPTSHGATCALCNAWRGALGLEPTPQLFVQHMVEVFREVRRVLRKDGTCWVNLGDSYAGASAGNTAMTGGKHDAARGVRMGFGQLDKAVPPGLKPKDLVGIPWRVAFALQEDGWWLRQDIIWAKPNPMPESVRDRCTKAHEYVFLLSKAERYFFDADAIRLTSSRTGLSGSNSHNDSTPTAPTITTTGWRPTCKCGLQVETVPCVVLDPFVGSGTTAIEAKRLGRRAVGIDLNAEYLDMAVRGLQLNRRPGAAASIPEGATPLPWGE